MGCFVHHDLCFFQIYNGSFSPLRFLRLSLVFVVIALIPLMLTCHSMSWRLLDLPSIFLYFFLAPTVKILLHLRQVSKSPTKFVGEVCLCMLILTKTHKDLKRLLSFSNHIHLLLVVTVPLALEVVDFRTLVTNIINREAKN